MNRRDLDPLFVLSMCVYELGGLAGFWRPLTSIFRERPWTFGLFSGWLFWHTWMKPGQRLAPRSRYPRGRMLP